MLEAFLALVTAHLLADFPLQTRGLLDRKREPLWFLIHIGIVTITTVLLTGSFDPRIWGVVAVTHAAMDYLKIRRLGDGIGPFAADQLVHLGVIAALAVWRPETVAEGWIGSWSTPVQTLAYQAMVLVSGVVLAVMTGGIVIGKLLDALGAERDRNGGATEDEEARGLPGGGEYIGWLERGLTLLFLLIGQPGGVGLMLAAKSILRFSDRNARAHTEYVIIGTLLSFGWAIVVGTAAQAALAHWS